MHLKAIPRSQAIALFVAIVVASIDPRIPWHSFDERDARRKQIALWADPHPELAAFLEGVRARTSKGDSIALLVPPRTWEEGYMRAYYRASYRLAGREVLPSIWTDGRLLHENVDRAKYVAAWHVRFRTKGQKVWQGNGGILVRQR